METKIEKINRFGSCPNCKTNWKGDDILVALSKLACNSGKSQSDLIKLANSYGWSENNKTHFSNTTSFEIGDRHLLECPNITCKHVFDRYTGDKFRNMFDARRNAPIIKEGEFPTNRNIPLSDPAMWKEKAVLHATAENRFEIEKQIEEMKKDKDCPF